MMKAMIVAAIHSVAAQQNVDRGGRAVSSAVTDAASLTQVKRL